MLESTKELLDSIATRLQLNTAIGPELPSGLGPQAAAHIVRCHKGSSDYYSTTAANWAPSDTGSYIGVLPLSHPYPGSYAQVQSPYFSADAPFRHFDAPIAPELTMSTAYQLDDGSVKAWGTSAEINDEDPNEYPLTAWACPSTTLLYLNFSIDLITYSTRAHTFLQTALTKLAHRELPEVSSTITPSEALLHSLLHPGTEAITQSHNRLRDLNSAVAELTERLASAREDVASATTSLNALVSQIDNTSLTTQCQELVDYLDRHPLITDWTIAEYHPWNTHAIQLTTSLLTLTNPDTGETAPLGNFFIRIGASRAQIYNVNNRKNNYDHPHIQEGRLCAGSLQDTCSTLLIARDYPNLLNTLFSILQTCNPDDTWGASHRYWFDDRMPELQDDFDHEPSYTESVHHVQERTEIANAIS